MFISLASLLAGCGYHRDPCASKGLFDEGPCYTQSEQGYRDIVWIDSAGARHAIDPAGYVSELSGYQSDGSHSESRFGFFLDPAVRSDGCRLAITYHDSGSWATGKDTVRAGGVRLQGYRPDGYPPWKPDDACGRIEFPDGMEWMVKTNSESFADVEGSGHGQDETYRMGIRWGRERMEATYHTRYWTVLTP
ncbi:MAG: hypothetical protein JF616_04605 [Fibrobacteres bacterium]|nr:hypothetical protein [Fibrobacterota bacterium]